MMAKHTKRPLDQGPIVQITMLNLGAEPIEEAQVRLLCHSGEFLCHTGGLKSELYAVEATTLFEERGCRVSSDQACERLSVK